MDNEIATPAATGISRREMLVGAGILAAGYGVGQLFTATEAHAAAIDPLNGMVWPAAWSTDAALEAAAQTAAIRGANRFRAGGG